MTMKEKIKGFFEENRKAIIGTAIAAGVFGTGYVSGFADCSSRIGRGLSMLFIADPELEGQMKDAIKVVNERV